MSRILIIDDDELVRDALGQLLRRTYDVAEASSGVDGLELFDRGGIDLVVTDIIMPDKEGLETIRELRQRDTEVKIVAVSGGGRVSPDSFLSAAETFGADLTFAKPFDAREFLAAVATLLAGDLPATGSPAS